MQSSSLSIRDCEWAIVLANGSTCTIAQGQIQKRIRRCILRMCLILSKNSDQVFPPGRTGQVGYPVPSRCCVAHDSQAQSSWLQSPCAMKVVNADWEALKGWLTARLIQFLSGSCAWSHLSLTKIMIRQNCRELWRCPLYKCWWTFWQGLGICYLLCIRLPWSWVTCHWDCNGNEIEGVLKCMHACMRRELALSKASASSPSKAMNAFPAAFWGIWRTTLPSFFLRSSNSSSMNVKLIPATAKGYSQSDLDPFFLCRRLSNRSGSFCTETQASISVPEDGIR